MSLYLENSFNIDKLKIEELIEFSEDLPISKNILSHEKILVFMILILIISGTIDLCPLFCL